MEPGIVPLTFHIKYTMAIWSGLPFAVCWWEMVFKQPFNSLWSINVIWRQGSRSTLAQVMAYCLTAPSHYLNVELSPVKSSGIYLRAISQKMSQPPITEISFKNYLSKISLKSPRGQWVKEPFTQWQRVGEMHSNNLCSIWWHYDKKE